MRTKYPKGWTVESTGGGCQWLRNGLIAITDGDAGLPVKGEPCVVVTLNKDGDCDELVDPISFGSLDAAFAFLHACNRIYGKGTCAS